MRALLRASTEEIASLYDGLQGEVLEDYAPYLVRLPQRSPLLERLVREGWGQSWGVYLTSPRPFKEVRRHLRRFLMVRLEGRSGEVYFRFYDPRVLRVFLPTCSPRQSGVFFGDVRSFLVEDGAPGMLLRFTSTEGGAVREAVPVIVPAPAP